MDSASNREYTRRADERYMRAGLSPIPVPAGEKNPNRPGWQNERWAIEDIPKLWNNGQNIGLLLGEPSGGLVDVDLDWPEARIAARYLLPDTRTSGRESQPDSHRWYYADPLPTTKPYKLPGKGDDRSVVELRSTGGQTVVAPSRHPDGDCYVWGAGYVASVDGAALMEGVADVAAAALIARNWPGQGARHDYALAATGYIGRHVSRERAERIMEAAIAASGDDEARKRWRDVTDTLDGLDAGRPTTGGPTLDTLAPGVVDQLRRWHRWGTERSTGHTHQPSMTATPFNTTDLGNAERLVAQHGEDLRYCYPWAKWLVWDGKRWAVDAAGELERRAVETVRAIYAEAEAAPDSDERRRIAKHAMASESRARIEAMMALARSQPSVPVAPDDLDADPWILNVQNGTIDLRTGALRPHRHEDLITKVVPVEYDPDAHAPRFAQFLREIFDGDEDLISFVRRFAGYSLTGSTAERAFAILHGSGKNGKTTLVELLRDVLGNYAINTDTETILRKKYTGVGNDVAALKGARFVSAAEVEQGRALAEAKVKNLTGTDTVTARFLFAEPFDFRPEFKLWLSTNNKPIIRGTDDAIWDRIRLIPFTRRFKGRDADTRLPEKLRAEMPGVLRWMVEGCLEWQRAGLGVPDKVVAATEGYRAEMDTLAAFIEERCIVRPDVWCKFADLYAAYVEWCKDSNEDAERKRGFANRLTERGFEAGNGAKNVAIRKGIALRHDSDPEPSKVNDPEPQPASDLSDNPPDSGQNVNPVNERVEFVNPRNADTYADNAGGVNEVNDKSTTFEANPPRVGVCWKDVNLINFVNPEGGGDSEQPVNPVNRVNPTNSGVTPRDDQDRDEVADLLADPPDWLAPLLDECREDPDRYLNSTSNNIATKLYGSPTRWREVKPILEEYLEGGASRGGAGRAQARCTPEAAQGLTP